MYKKQLVEEALEARKMSYAPYSHFNVGAALLTKEGRIYRGCNIENASYSPTNCAERTAFFKAVSEGDREFKAIAIVGGLENSTNLDICSPCGVCRQVMMEFCNPKEFEIVLCDSDNKIITYKLEDLLPLGFVPDNLI